VVASLVQGGDPWADPQPGMSGCPQLACWEPRWEEEEEEELEEVAMETNIPSLASIPHH